ncbi:DUF389 domain-containing protein [Desulfovibrio inopinatus]|uniref:DUF389 domain-containing protein n=1 Tax=Desulfovibrio inopinatus TaxID=102109 RepID=UPI00042A76D0|nr:DUF389 domain-containing protein [Desulfovibrio inopinatus]
MTPTDPGPENKHDTTLRLANSPLQGLIRRFRVTPERFEFIYDDIFQGSTPEMGYYALISAAALIASLGLVANSVAVVIGAMLVSPLMTPIFGMAMGMIRGNPQLLGRAIKAEVGGVLLAIAFGYLFGLLPIMTGITPEMIARTEPTLLDLLVAVFAGLAGTLAVVDARISPALPGVAISTAIVPPLATSGLCLALGSYDGAIGAFLLFFANFLAILLVSSLTFLMCGMGQFEQQRHKTLLVQRLIFAVVCFLVVAFFLTNALIQVLQARTEELAINNVLTDAMKPNPNASFTSMRFKDVGDEIHIIAMFRTSRIFTPRDVRILENKLQDRLQRPVRLVTRCSLAKDIAPTGSLVTDIDPTLDGKFYTEELDWRARTLSIAEQTLREYFDGKPQYFLVDVNLTELSGDDVILATLQSPRQLVALEIKKLEELLNTALGKDPSIRLLVRDVVAGSITSTGRVLFGKAHFGPQPEDAIPVKEAVIKHVQTIKGFFADNVDVIQNGDGFVARAEVVGPRGFSSEDVAKVEKAVKEQLGVAVKLQVWTRVELMVDDTSSESMDAYSEARFRKQLETIASRKAPETTAEEADPDLPDKETPQDSIDSPPENDTPTSSSK